MITVVGTSCSATLAIATAEDNNCTYCLSVHAYTGAGVTTLGAAELPATQSPPYSRIACSARIIRGHVGETQLRLPGPWASASPMPRPASSQAIRH